MTTLRQQLVSLSVCVLAAGGGCAKSHTSGDNGGSPKSGIALPSEISALPANTTSQSNLALNRSRFMGVRSQALATDNGTDYASATTVKYVNEQELSQFDILNTIFKAVGQTHYADPENVNQGKYGANVSWEEDHGGDGEQKRIVSWVVDSGMVVVDGKTANRLQVWMKMPMGDDGSLHLIKVQLTIYEAPVQDADGTYSDYGVWRLDASLGDDATWYFVATADRDNGVPVVMIHQMERGQETRGILKRSAASGYGQVEAPDYNNCGSSPCPVVHVAYAYDAAHVALKILNANAGVPTYVYKDREQAVDVVEKYGLYDAETGADVAKAHHFGFPIRYTDASGNQQWGSYGAWMGRHQIWTNGATIPEGTSVTRADQQSGQAKTYTVSPKYTGILVKRTLVASNLAALTNVPLQTWDGQNGQIWIVYNGASWVKKQPVLNSSSWPPPFEAGGDSDYSFQQSMLYLNSPGGANFVVTQTNGSYDVKIEVQKVATPKNASDFDGVVLTQQWAGQGASTYSFDASAFTLKYAQVGPDAEAGKSQGSPVTTQRWGLVGPDNVQYNWEYPDAQSQCTNCGVQQYLTDGAEVVLLDDPIRLAPIALTNRGGQSQTYSLQFDGNWINGLPNLYDNQGKFNIGTAANLAVAMPTTPVLDADGTKSYLFKQLRVSEYLLPIADPNDPGIDLTNASTLGLDSVPTFVDHSLGDWPSNVAVKYSEGNLVPQ